LDCITVVDRLYARYVARSVIIVGAGPAGSAAAIELARAGADVTLIDKAVLATTVAAMA
jgi:2-polyprenyl-6-methoxyphenol hydroxylase-like FAD-dependent oxidoreductase